MQSVLWKRLRLTYFDFERLRLFGDFDLDRPPRDLLRLRGLRDRLDERRRRERERLRLRLERLDERDLPPRPTNLISIRNI